MKILVVGDSHGDLAWMGGKVIPEASRQGCDRIVQLGDFGFVWSDMLTSVQSLEALDGFLEPLGIELYFLPGNHENHPQLESLAKLGATTPEGHHWLSDRVTYTGRVSSWVWEGIRFAAIGGAVSIDRSLRTPGESWWPEETLTPEEVEQARALGPVDVLFSHEAPLLNPFQYLKSDMESEISRRTMSDIAQALCPRRWYHGHYHVYDRYEFRHRLGLCEVVALNCNGRRRSTELLTISREAVDHEADEPGRADLLAE